MEVRVTAPDDEEGMQEIPKMAPPPTRSSLGVPQPIKSNIGVNNPLNRGGLTAGSPLPAGLFPMPGSAQVAGGSATGSGRKKVMRYLDNLLDRKSRGPPKDIIHYFTLMSSKLTLFYIIFENFCVVRNI